MQTQTESTPTTNTLRVTSSAFGANGSIPIQHTADGADVAPPLAWSGVPRGTQSIALLVEDPDAPGRIFVHWVVAGIPPEVTELPGGDALPEGAGHGINDYGVEGWRGPNPPSGRHRYFFRVFALDIDLRQPPPNKPRLTKAELMGAIKGHVLAQGELIGTYEKSGHTRDRTSNAAIPKQVR